MQPTNMQPAASALVLTHGALALPAYLPDATYGVVRAVDATDLERCEVAALMMNTFHLMQRPGSSTVRALGGLHRLSGWQRPIFTDSGGFQAYSLIQQSPRFGQMTENGISFTPEGAGRKYQLTPEKAIQLQLGYGSDVAICLDECTHVDAPLDAQQISVRRTVAWARRCRREFDRLIEEKGLDAAHRPLLFAVIQGGGSRELRRRCAEELLEIGFDGYGYGGWPLDAQGHLLREVLAYTRACVPSHLPLHALGVGHPANVLECFRLGYTIFDSAMPTRDARHARLYTFTSDPATTDFAGAWFAYIYMGDEKHTKSDQPISSHCDCPTCARYSRGYLHHLFKIDDGLFPRLATIHNLRFMTRLMTRLAADDGNNVEKTEGTEVYSPLPRRKDESAPEI